MLLLTVNGDHHKMPSGHKADIHRLYESQPQCIYIHYNSGDLWLNEHCKIGDGKILRARTPENLL